MDRLPAVALTRTDWGIHLYVAARLGMKIESYLLRCMTADNIDADLMLLLAQWPTMARDVRLARALDHVLDRRRGPRRRADTMQ